MSRFKEVLEGNGIIMSSQAKKVQNKESREVDNGKDKSFEEMVNKASHGDRASLNSLCEKIARGVLFRAAHVLGNKADAEDLAQEILIRVCERISTLRDPNSFKFWLSKIASNETNRYLSKKAKTGVLLDIDEYLENILEDRRSFVPHEFVESVEYGKSVMEVISTLSVRQREAVMLHYYDSLSVAEVADIMNITRQGVSEHLTLSREKIKRELEKSEKVPVMAAMPIGLLMTDALQQEAALYMSQNTAWLSQAMACCSEYISAASVAAPAVPAAVEATAASSSLFGIVLGGVAALFTAAALAVGISVSSPQDFRPSSGDIYDVVVFSGGIEYGDNTVYVNPRDAKPQSVIDGDGAVVLHWWIKEADSTENIVEGDSSVVDEAMIRLLDDGEYGEYWLYFRIESNSGTIYTLNSNFYIQSASP